METPLIGITSTDRNEELVSSVWYAAAYSVPAQYIDAIRRAGGNPVMLPPGERYWDQWLDVVDGVVVTGGSDVDSRLYGGDPAHPRQDKVQLDRDATEIALARRLVNGDTPALFVCRGMQVLNVAMGGTLHQHVADFIDDDMHRGPGEGWTFHDIEVASGSLAAKAMETDSIRTASGHHQAIAEVGDGLIPVAWANDGIVEALEVDSPTWLVAVQWHPEVSAHDDPSQQGLFDDLVTATRL